MPTIYTLSAYETSAQDFFESLRRHKTDLVLDVRLKNTSQLCGFTKRNDWAYLVPAITGAAYIHDVRFAPDEVLLERYLHKLCTWDEYCKAYQKQMRQHKRLSLFKSVYGSYQIISVLGTATKNRRSHSEALQLLLTRE